MLRYPSPGVWIESTDKNPLPLKLTTTSAAGFVGLAQRGPLHTPVRIHSWEEFKTIFGEPVTFAHLPWAVAGYFENGGQSCVVVRVAHLDPGQPTTETSAASLLLNDQEQKPYLRIQAIEPGTWGNAITLSVVPLNEPAGAFHFFVQYKKQREEYRQVSLDPGHERYVLSYVNSHSRLIQVAAVPGLKDPSPMSLENLCLENGRDGLAAMHPGDFLGQPEGEQPATGLHALQRFEEAVVLAIPDAVNVLLFTGQDGAQQVKMIQQGLIDYCHLHPLRFALLDPPPTLDLAGITAWRRQFDSSRAALYYPSLRILDSDGRLLQQPPSGHVAGLLSRLDRESLMKKNPANEPLAGAVGTLMEFDVASLELLHQRHINPIRTMKGRGLRVWGARTLSSAPEWRHINTRRLISRIEQSLQAGMAWAIFEPNYPDLWKTLIRSATGFLLDLWKDGYLSGVTPEEAFYVKCDEETNPEAERDLGRVTVEVGLAIARPAEFFVVRISEKTMEA